MIKIENVETAGWEPALRGMRNPLNSWDKADSEFTPWDNTDFTIGSNDHDLAMRLRNAGTDHRKFLRMIVCYCDITAPLYWHKEMDTYRSGVEKNSCSTMHKIAAKEFTLGDFSHEHMTPSSIAYFRDTVYELNFWRDMYLSFHDDANVKKKIIASDEPMDKKDCWWQMIQILPSSYNQKRTYMISYEALANMYHARKSHKLDEWRNFCEWIKTLPYSELITGEEEK